jgi:hypothetical protein
MKEPRGRVRAIQTHWEVKRFETLLTPGADHTRAAKRRRDSQSIPGTIRVIFDVIHRYPMLSRDTREGRSHPDGDSITLEQKQPAGAQSTVSLFDGCGSGSNLLRDGFEQRRAAKFCRGAIHGDLDGSYRNPSALVQKYGSISLT